MTSSILAGVGWVVAAGAAVSVGMTSMVAIGLVAEAEGDAMLDATGCAASCVTGAEQPVSDKIKIRKRVICLFTSDTRPFDGFHEPFLQDKVHDEQRQDV